MKGQMDCAESAFDAGDLPEMYRQMLRIRLLEEEIARRYGEWQMRCPTHLCIGQEATAVGICHFLQADDTVFSNHRAHGHYLAKGGDMTALVAELYGKRDGCAGGRGGSMHLIDRAAGFAGSTPIVGGTVPLAVGAAWAAKLARDDRVAVVFFGDGCFEEGVLHESMNFAALHRLPVLFVCENNGLSVYTRLDERQPQRPLYQVAAGHGLTTHNADGNNVLSLAEVACRAVVSARNGDGPQFIELATHRWLEHCGPNDDDDLGYRRPGELRVWKQRDPLELTRCHLLSGFGFTVDDLERTRVDVSDEVQAAFAAAEASLPPVADNQSLHLSRSTQGRPKCFLPLEGSKTEPRGVFGGGLYSSDSVPQQVQSKVPGRVISYAEAIREGLEQAMVADPSVILIGEGVPDPKGVFGTTSGLRDRFGPERVFDMPLAENGMTGICIGAAMQGLRPVMVHQRIDFALLAMDQLINNAAKLAYLFEGRVQVPLVVRLIVGRGWGQGPQHGQSLQALFAHIPGLKVIMPTTAVDAKGMLLAAIADEGPVLFIEHRWLHHICGEVPAAAIFRPLRGAQRLRAGDQITIAAFSHMVVEALKAAEWLSSHGVEAEVIDMRAVTPLDVDTVADAVRRSGYLLVADTGHRKNGVAADLVCSVVEREWSALRAAPRVVALPDQPLPTSHFLADHYYPDAADIAQQVLGLLGCERLDAVVALRKPEPRDQPDRDFTGPF